LVSRKKRSNFKTTFRLGGERIDAGKVQYYSQFYFQQERATLEPRSFKIWLKKVREQPPFYYGAKGKKRTSGKVSSIRWAPDLLPKRTLERNEPPILVGGRTGRVNDT